MSETSVCRPHSAVDLKCRAVIVVVSLFLMATSISWAPNLGSAEIKTLPNATELPRIADSYVPPTEGEAQYMTTKNYQLFAGVNENVQRAILNATRMAGTDATYLLVVAARESSFDPHKHAYRTSATGLYQFTADTWLRAIRTFGAKYGLESYARHIVVDPHGRVSVRNSSRRSKLLALRRDPQLSALMAAELSRDNELRLTRLLRRPVSPAEVYMAHLLGVTDAANFIRAAHLSAHTSGAQLLPAAAEANPAVFKPGGQVASARSIVQKIEIYYEREEQRFSVPEPLQEG